MITNSIYNPFNWYTGTAPNEQVLGENVCFNQPVHESDYATQFFKRTDGLTYEIRAISKLTGSTIASASGLDEGNGYISFWKNVLFSSLITGEDHSLIWLGVYQADVLQYRTPDLLFLEGTSSRDYTQSVQVNYRTSFVNTLAGNKNNWMTFRLVGQYFHLREITENEVYEQSTGGLSVPFIQAKFQRRLDTGYMPAYMHQNLVKALMHDEVYVGSALVDSERVIKEEAYDSTGVNRYSLRTAQVWLTKADIQPTNVYGEAYAGTSYEIPEDVENFSAVFDDPDVDLTWDAVVDSPQPDILIQWSLDGANWQALTIEDASTGAYTHTTPQSGQVNYYRAKIGYNLQTEGAEVLSPRWAQDSVEITAPSQYTIQFNGADYLFFPTPYQEQKFGQFGADKKVTISGLIYIPSGSTEVPVICSSDGSVEQFFFGVRAGKWTYRRTDDANSAYIGRIWNNTLLTDQWQSFVLTLNGTGISSEANLCINQVRINSYTNDNSGSYAWCDDYLAKRLGYDQFNSVFAPSGVLLDEFFISEGYSFDSISASLVQPVDVIRNQLDMFYGSLIDFYFRFENDLTDEANGYDLSNSGGVTFQSANLPV